MRSRECGYRHLGGADRSGRVWRVDEGALQGLRGTWRVPWSMGKVSGWGHWGGAEERLMQMEAFFKLTSSPQHTSASLRVNFQKQTKTTKTIPRLS